MAKNRKYSTSKTQTQIFTGLGLVAVLTFLFYQPSLENGFVTWDDDIYVLNNPLIRDLSASTLSSIFTEFLWGNYHPMTVLSLNLDFKIWGLNPYGYHLHNILLHILNTCLLGWIVYRFPIPAENQKLKRNELLIPSLTAALLFGLHPLHVESVTWVSERKDVLYTAFLLIAWIFWDLYKTEGKSQHLWTTLLFFVLSCLSKGMALIFPLLLLGYDMYLSGEIVKKDIIAKWPFWLISLCLGIVAILAQQSVGAIREDVGYSIFDNLIVALYGLCWYLWKMLIPLNLSAFYPYPKKAAGEFLPWIFYLSPIILAGITYVCWKLRKTLPELGFAWIWYIASMIMVVKLVPLSEAMTADRYFYLSSAGICLAAGMIISRYTHKPVIVYAPIILALIWGYLTHTQTKIWKDDLSLFGEMIRQHPDLSLAYNNRGKYLFQQGKKEEAIQDFIKSAELDPDNESAQNNVGFILLENNKLPEAVTYFKKAVEIHPEFADGYFNLGNAYARMNNYPAAIGSYRKSLSLMEANPGVWNNLGNVYKETGKFDSAQYAYTKSLELDPNGKNAMTGLGETEEKLGNLNDARNWYKKASERNPADADLMNKIGISYAKTAEYPDAIIWFKKASETNPKEIATWQNLAMAYERTGQIPDAIKAYQEAAKLGSPGAQQILKKNGVSW